MLICLFRTVILYALLILVIRLMGKRQLGEMGPLEFVVAILIADLASVPMQDLAIPLLSGIIPILTILAAELLLSVLCYRFPIWRRLFSGKPVILMENGTLLQKNLSKTRITPDELTELLREKEVVDLRTVQYAILETNGQISALVYPEEKPASAREAGIPVQPHGLSGDDHQQRAAAPGKPAGGGPDRGLGGGRAAGPPLPRPRRLSADRGARRADLSQRPGAGMKHLLIGLSLVAAVTGFCLWSASYVRGAVEETARLLEAAYEAAEADQFSQARAAVQAASDTWDRYGGYFGTVLRHDEIDGVVEEFARLQVTVQAGDQDEFLPGCAALLETLDHVRDMELPVFANLF